MLKCKQQIISVKCVSDDGLFTHFITCEKEEMTIKIINVLQKINGNYLHIDNKDDKIIIQFQNDRTFTCVINSVLRSFY